MSDRKVLAVLIKAGDTALDRPLGVGGLINENVALVVLDEKAELGSLAELEVLITPVPLADGDVVERIKPAAAMVGKLNGTSETMAGIRLAHPSRHGRGCPTTRDALVLELAAEKDVWRAGQKLGDLGDRLSDVEITKALENARAAEEEYSARELRFLGEPTAEEIGANCAMGCGENCR
ncbi:hypothetical protein FKR81_16935 [Lentzea tibetensis]|uniref:Uncharacterized protein n=1 Tax=Lentzea tibetensis TaxID=2591470 RepID=A0A563EUG0_9PSEU|nr:hypothetical protein [Lentzea tibetensis]TWP51293.1 hypothetical protein FKR81_16935 [Lentzea tibetensis]